MSRDSLWARIPYDPTSSEADCECPLWPTFQFFDEHRGIATVVQDCLYQLVDSFDKREIDLLLFKNSFIFIPAYSLSSKFFSFSSFSGYYIDIRRCFSFYIDILFFIFYYFRFILFFSKSYSQVLHLFFRCSFQVLSSWCSHTCLNKPGEPLVLTESGKSPFQLRGTISNEQALAYIRSGTSNSWYVVNQLLC